MPNELLEYALALAKLVGTAPADKSGLVFSTAQNLLADTPAPSVVVVALRFKNRDDAKAFQQFASGELNRLKASA